MNNYASNPLPGGQRAPRGGLRGKLNSEITVHLSLMRLMMIFSIMILLIVWAFFIGVLMGRGEKPEEVVPEIARMMPSANSTVSASTSLVAEMLEKGTGVEENSISLAEKNKEPQPEVAPTPKNGIIKAENLDLMDGMKNKPGRDDLTTEPLPTNIPPQKEKNKPKEKATTVENKVEKEVQTKDKKAKAKESDKEQAKNTASSSGQFDYVYQVAASTDAAAAEKLKNKITSMGISANIQSGEKDGKTLYRIQVNYRGKPEQIKDLRKELEKAGIDRVILKTKTPVQ